VFYLFLADSGHLHPVYLNYFNSGYLSVKTFVMRTDKKIIFPKDSTSGFYFELKQKIAPVINQHAEKALWMTRFKVLFFPLLNIAAYTLLLTTGHQLFWFYFFYAILGILLPLTVLNLVHDALHHSLFKSATANRLAAYLLDLLGGNSFVWHKRHVHFHHSFTNIPGWDIDLEKKKIFRLSPTDKLRWAHRYQHLYMPLVYLLFTFHWVIFRDFKDYFQPQSMFRQRTKVPLSRYFELIAFKVFYFLYILVIPIFILPHAWQHYLLGFLLLHALASMLTLMIILPTHWDENAEFRISDSTLTMKESWPLHQLITTNDYATFHPVPDFLLGGLNYHIAHHLFPNINHNFLPHITKEIIKITKEKNLPYKSFSWAGAIRSHFLLLKKNGVSDILEEG
jgi:linoleoyl-CoA desaturase